MIHPCRLEEYLIQRGNESCTVAVQSTLVLPMLTSTAPFGVDDVIEFKIDRTQFDWRGESLKTRQFLSGQKHPTVLAIGNTEVQMLPVPE